MTRPAQPNSSMTARYSSSTLEVPPTSGIPRHVAIIMDGNGRWAKQRHLPRVAGHRRGVDALRTVITACVDRKVQFLTVFAFSSENWRRPAEEVSVLQQLFISALENEVEKMHRNGIRLKTVGDLAPFGPKIVELVKRGESLTEGNTRMTLTIAANYGGRWDLLQAVNRIRQNGGSNASPITESQLAEHLAMNYAPEPDLFIRTGGEQRISNFLLWQLAYTELYFTDALWPDFNAAALDAAIEWYGARERRFGRTSDQLSDAERASYKQSSGLKSA
jgi:undecaprenyl diphosphate synthase